VRKIDDGKGFDCKNLFKTLRRFQENSTQPQTQGIVEILSFENPFGLSLNGYQPGPAGEMNEVELGSRRYIVQQTLLKNDHTG